MEGKTDYRKRLALIKSGKPRLVIRKSNKHILLQLVDFNVNGDRIITSSHTTYLRKLGWQFSGRNMPAAYLAGLRLGILALEKNIKDAVLDSGLHPSVKGSVIYSAMKGVIDAGVNVPHSKEILPDEQRISGAHIVTNSMTKSKHDAKEIINIFNGIKSKLLKK